MNSTESINAEFTAGFQVYYERRAIVMTVVKSLFRCCKLFSCYTNHFYTFTLNMITVFNVTWEDIMYITCSFHFRTHPQRLRAHAFRNTIKGLIKPIPNPCLVIAFCSVTYTPIVNARMYKYIYIYIRKQTFTHLLIYDIVLVFMTKTLFVFV